MGRSCMKAQITAHHAALGNSKGHKSIWCGFPKTLECEKWVRFLYNCVAALYLLVFLLALAILIHIQMRSPLGLESLHKGTSSDLDLRDGGEVGRW